MKWEKKTLDELGTVGRGRSKHRPRNDPKLFGGKYPFIQTADVKNANFYIINFSSTYNEEGLAQSKLWPAGTLCITIAANIADTGILAIPACFPDSIMGFVANEEIADTRFVKYCFDVLQKECKQISQGTAQDNLSWEKLSTIKFLVPPLQTQKRIASILSAYDDIIENNQKQIKLLEEAAQRLYKEWFVDLRFPGHESVKIVDGVPEGWNKVRLDAVTSVLKRGISPKYDENGEFTVINQKCIRKNIVDYSESRKQSKKYAEELQLQESDTVICSTGIGTLGRVGQIYNVYQNSTFDSHVTLVRANKLIGKQFLFWSLKLLQPYLMSLGKGSTNQQELYKSDLAACFLLLPEEYIMNAFERQAQELHDTIAVKTKQISSLREARDRLLPKLMSGEIEV